MSAVWGKLAAVGCLGRVRGLCCASLAPQQSQQLRLQRAGPRAQAQEVSLGMVPADQAWRSGPKVRRQSRLPGHGRQALHSCRVRGREWRSAGVGMQGAVATVGELAGALENPAQTGLPRMAGLRLRSHSLVRESPRVCSPFCSSPFLPSCS